MEYPKVESLAITCDQVQEHKMVFVVTENRLAVMAAVHDVVARFLGPLQATGQAGHRMGLRKVLRRSSAGTGRYFTSNFICAKVLRRASPFLRRFPSYSIRGRN